MTKRQFITAIITDKRGRVLAIGKNSYSKSHPRMKQLSESCGEPFKTTLHAEVAAIIHCKDLSKAHKISVYRYSQTGKPLIAKPCKICQTAIDQAGIRTIDFTTTE